MRRLGVRFSARPRGAHRHNWQKLIKNKYGAVFYLHVCTEHPEPVMQAYDMEVEDASLFQGSNEFQGKSIRV